MTQKNNILTVVTCIYAVLVLSACVTEKKKTSNTGGVSAEYCKIQRKDYDSFRKVCKAPDLTFCAIQLNMIKGMDTCKTPAGQTDCDTLGSAKGKTLVWKSNKCEAASNITNHGKLDSSIIIDWKGKQTVQGAQSSFVDIGRATITIKKNHDHQVFMMKKAGSTCELQRGRAGGKNFRVKAKGPASTCKGKILVINTKTGDYNVKDFDVTLN